MGKIFKNDNEYKSKYYSRKPTEKQLQALQDWNKFTKEVGKKYAIAQKKAVKQIKSGQFDKYQSGTSIATHDAVSLLMDLIAKSDRDDLRENNELMYKLVDYVESLVGEAEAKNMGLLTYQQVTDLYNAWSNQVLTDQGIDPNASIDDIIIKLNPF